MHKTIVDINFILKKLSLASSAELNNPQPANANMAAPRTVVSV